MHLGKEAQEINLVVSNVIHVLIFVAIALYCDKGGRRVKLFFTCEAGFGQIGKGR